MIYEYGEALSKVAAKINENNSFTLLTHRRPDGDTLGSAYGLASILKRMGKRVAVINERPIDEKFAFLGDELETDKADGCVIAIDCGAGNMIGDLADEYLSRVEICIDHHETNNGWAPITCLKTYAACAEIIIDLAQKLDVEIDRYAARALYVGLSTDTGCFKYGNTDAHAHASAAKLLEICGDVLDLNYKFFTVKTIMQLKLEKLVGERLEIFAGGHGSIACITSDDIKAVGASFEELENLTDTVRALEGIYIGALVKQSDENIFRVSLRGNLARYNVSAICKMFGGGGHPGAGGCTIEGDKDTVCKKLKEAIEEYLCRE